jgi:hypothetical protein
LQLITEKKGYYAIKQPKHEFVSTELYENIFFIKPYQSLSTIPITEHPIIESMFLIPAKKQWNPAINGRTTLLQQH